MSIAGVLHDGGHIGKVQIDDAGNVDQIGDALHCLQQHLICLGKGIGKGDLFLRNAAQPFIGNDQQSVYMLLQPLDAGSCLLHTPLTLKGEGLGDNADGQNTHIVGNTGNHGSRTGAGAAAHACGDIYHIGTAQHRGDLIFAFLRCLFALHGVAAGTLPAGQLIADVQLVRGIGKTQGLIIGINRDKFHAAHAGLDHAVDGISAAAADAQYLDRSHFFVIVIQLYIHHQHYCLLFRVFS